MQKFKLVLLGLVLGVGCVLWAGASTTRISSYATLDTIADVNATPDTDPNGALGCAIAAVTGEYDVLRGREGAGGSETYANNVALILHAATAANGDTVTQVLYGRVDGGPRQRIASIAWKIGLGQVTTAVTTTLWAETATVTSDHASTITVSGDDGDDRVGQVLLDLTGYRYIKSYFTAETGDPTTVTCLYRHF